MGDGQSHGYAESQCRKGNHAYGTGGTTCMRCGRKRPAAVKDPLSNSQKTERSRALELLAGYLDRDSLLDFQNALEQVTRVDDLTVRIGYDDGPEGSGIGIDNRGVFAYEKRDGWEYVTYVQTLSQD